MFTTTAIRWLCVAGTILGLTVLGSLYITERVAPKVYVATSEIRVAPSLVLLDGSNVSIFEVMKSSQVLMPIITDLGLDQAWAKRVYKSDRDRLLPDDAIAYMNKMVKLDYSSDTHIIAVSASSDLPKEAADIANAIVDRYKTMRDMEQTQRNNRGRDALRDQIAEQQKVVDAATLQVQNAQPPPEAPSLGAAEKEELQLKLEDHRKELAREQQKYAGYSALLNANAGDPNSTIAIVVRPELVQKKALIDSLQKEVSDLEAQIKGPEPKLSALPAAEAGLRHQQSELDALKVRAEEVDRDRSAQESSVLILARAQPPTISASPNRIRSLAASIAIGAVLGTMTATLVEIFLWLAGASKPRAT